MLRLIAIAVVCTMLLIPIAGFSSHIISNRALLVAVSFGLAYVAIPALLLKVWPAPSVPRRKSMQNALWDAELLTTEYEARSVAQIQEHEDEGLHFLVTTETGATLCLAGQYLYGPVECGLFPSERVRTFTNKTTGALYGIEPIGQPLAIWPLYEPFDVEQAKSDCRLEDGVSYAQSIAEIVATLGLQPAQRSNIPGVHLE